MDGEFYVLKAETEYLGAELIFIQINFYFRKENGD